MYLLQSDDDGRTLLHIAAWYGRSPKFCKVFIDQNEILLEIADEDGFLPIHHACNRDGIDLYTVKYFFRIYPESINVKARGLDGDYPLLMLFNSFIESTDERREIARGNKAMLVEFILTHDSGVLSTQNGHLEDLLHLVSDSIEYHDDHQDVLKVILDAHPELTLSMDSENLLPFVQMQLVWQCEAVLNRVPDENGQLPIHRVLATRDATLFAIKLMIAANPDSTAVADSQGCIPLHLACRFGTLKIVEYLVKLNSDSPTTDLDVIDAGGNLPLHHACLGGNLDIVNYILEACPHGVTVSNTEGKLPITILLFDAGCARDQYHVDTVDSLLRAKPKDSLANLSPGLFKRKRGE